MRSVHKQCQSALSTQSAHRIHFDGDKVFAYAFSRKQDLLGGLFGAVIFITTFDFSSVKKRKNSDILLAQMGNNDYLYVPKVKLLVVIRTPGTA